VVTAPADHLPTLPAAAEVSALIAWMRRLSDTGFTRVDPAELAAFHRAKQDLLERIQHPGHAQTTTDDQSRGDTR
jgi:hypothetical protein